MFSTPLIRSSPVESGDLLWIAWGCNYLGVTGFNVWRNFFTGLLISQYLVNSVVRETEHGSLLQAAQTSLPSQAARVVSSIRCITAKIIMEF